jgi:Bacterial Ig-like domain (group 3)
MKTLGTLALMFFGGSAMFSSAQSTGTVTETVNQRNTIGTLSSSPSGSTSAGTPITFTYTLNTAGAPAPAETVQFYDGGTALGGAQSIGSASASNLLPYSQVNSGQGWTTTGTTMTTLTPLNANGPDGSTNTATTLQFADGTSTVLYAVPGTSYATQQLTFSIWAKTASTATLNLTLKDGSGGNASSPAACSVTSTWQRCSVTYTFPISTTGFTAVLTASTYTTPINVWGAQVEVAAQPGSYVSTIGAARPSVSGGAGTVTYSYTTGFTDGSHPITVHYGGDANLVASTSNVVTLTVGKATPNLTLTASPSSGAVYGGTVTLTAVLANPDSGSPLYPGGTVTFSNNGSQIGTGTLTEVGSGNTSTYVLTLTGASSLPAGSDSLTVSYGGDSNFNTANDTSTPITYLVAKASINSVITTTVASSLNPSVYGDLVTLTINVSSSVGVQPTGSVTIVDTTTSTTLGTPTLDGSGKATITVPGSGVSLFNAGTHAITVTYSGDSNYQ